MHKNFYGKGFNYKTWYLSYSKKCMIDMYKYFTNKELYILNRFGIILENRLYTKKEFEVINMHLYKHYKTDKADRILDNPFFVENGFTKKDYEKILNIFNKIAIDYNL